jgi:hypothetical protein
MHPAEVIEVCSAVSRGTMGSVARSPFISELP